MAVGMRGGWINPSFSSGDSNITSKILLKRAIHTRPADQKSVRLERTIDRLSYS